MNKKSETLRTWTFIHCKPSTVTTGPVPVMVFSDGGNWWISPCGISQILLIKTALCPTPLSGIWSIRQSFLRFFSHLHLWKGTSAQRHKIPYCTTSKVAWQHKHMALSHQWCFYIFLYRTALLSFSGLAVGWRWNFYLYSERGPHSLQRGSIWQWHFFSSPSKVL